MNSVDGIEIYNCIIKEGIFTYIDSNGNFIFRDRGFLGSKRWYSPIIGCFIWDFCSYTPKVYVL